MNILKIFGLHSVKPYAFPTELVMPSPDPSLIYGIELEIERADDEWCSAGFEVTDDGSLRNNGREFISAPMTYANMHYALKNFFDRLHLDSDNYSERTSIHVHTNCQDLTVPQLTSLLMLYQVFEDVLFNWIGHDRDKNIFCVPWSQTKITHNALADITNFVSLSSVDRNKYTALNLVPLRSYGTVEWRHMEGHCDLHRIMRWMRIIGHMFRIARTMEHSEVVNNCVNLNTTSQYDQLLDFVFQDEAIHLRVPNYRLLLENGVLNMKYSLQMKSNVKEAKVSVSTATTAGQAASVFWADVDGPSLVTRSGIEALRARLGRQEPVPVTSTVTDDPF